MSKNRELSQIAGKVQTHHVDCDSADFSGDVTAATFTGGNITTTGYIRGPATFTVDPAAHNDSTGTLRILGNLTVEGTTTTINSTTVETSDLALALAKDAIDSAACQGAGITVASAGANFTYDHSNTRWDANKDLSFGALNDAASTLSTDGILVLSSDPSAASANSSVIFRVDNVGAMQIHTNKDVSVDQGKFGIGTTTPATPVHIRDFDSDMIRWQGTFASGAANTRGETSYFDGSSKVASNHLYYDGTSVNMVWGSFYNSGYTTTNVMELKGTGDLIVSGSVDAITYAGDGSALTGLTESQITDLGTYVATTGDQTISGTKTFTGVILSGTSGGGQVALTTNDGGGNANVTFNHVNNAPDASGLNAGRITVNTDASTNGSMAFEVGTAVTGAIAQTHIMYATGDFHADGDVIAYSTTTSDARLKDNVTTIENGLDKVCAMRGVEFDWNATSRKGQHDIGVIAQEMEAVIPEIVREKTLCTGEYSDGNEFTVKTVDYEKLVGVLIEAVKELKAEIDELKSV